LKAPGSTLINEKEKEQEKNANPQNAAGSPLEVSQQTTN